ncbi:alpha,alpha-trehalase TreF [Saccharicrinis sp. FJH54]|uniref:alpha,alpha-trehalase TreF n=1 Tax=Saccharicrinis sp. FJH54 TaxID=3344665 RepID=UPI0035D4552D
MNGKGLTITLIIFVTLLTAWPVSSQVDPVQKYGELFKAVQTQQIFHDQKRFADCPAKTDPDSILILYHNQKDQPGFNLRHFVGTYFDTIQADTAAMIRHITMLWNTLTRQPEVQNPNSSRIALPEPYVVPGGRFTEMYYWDSYFTMLGLQVSGRSDLMEHMISDFAWLIDTYGHIPNGNRTYYLSRSQPPFFSLMVELLAETKHDSTILIRFLPEIEKEYAYWMSGNKIVKYKRGKILNRYYDELNTPRPESYLHDVKTFEASGRDSSIFRDIRSAAESGWDFSTRWFSDGEHLEQIITTQYLPVDLNCLIYHMEMTLSKAYRLKNTDGKSEAYAALAEQRKALIQKVFWNKQKAYFFDYNVKENLLSEQETLAGLFPLFFNIATPEQAQGAADYIRNAFLLNGGLVTTLTEHPGQQWDYPNGWAPLQWIGYVAMKNYGYNTLAQAIAERWLSLNMKVYFETGKMTEKYNVVNTELPGGGGEYNNQDGFGWTNGVFLKMREEIKSNK